MCVRVDVNGANVQALAAIERAARLASRGSLKLRTLKQYLRLCVEGLASTSGVAREVRLAAVRALLEVVDAPCLYSWSFSKQSRNGQQDPDGFLSEMLRHYLRLNLPGVLALAVQAELKERARTQHGEDHAGDELLAMLLRATSRVAVNSAQWCFLLPFSDGCANSEEDGQLLREDADEGDAHNDCGAEGEARDVAFGSVRQHWAQPFVAGGVLDSVRAVLSEASAATSPALILPALTILCQLASDETPSEKHFWCIVGGASPVPPGEWLRLVLELLQHENDKVQDTAAQLVRDMIAADKAGHKRCFASEVRTVLAEGRLVSWMAATLQQEKAPIAQLCDMFNELLQYSRANLSVAHSSATGGLLLALVDALRRLARAKPHSLFTGSSLVVGAASSLLLSVASGNRRLLRQMLELGLVPALAEALQAWMSERDAAPAAAPRDARGLAPAFALLEKLVPFVAEGSLDLLAIAQTAGAATQRAMDDVAGAGLRGAARAPAVRLVHAEDDSLLPACSSLLKALAETQLGAVSVHTSAVLEELVTLRTTMHSCCPKFPSHQTRLAKVLDQLLETRAKCARSYQQVERRWSNNRGGAAGAGVAGGMEHALSKLDAFPVVSCTGYRETRAAEGGMATTSVCRPATTTSNTNKRKSPCGHAGGAGHHAHPRASQKTAGHSAVVADKVTRACKDAAAIRAEEREVEDGSRTPEPNPESARSKSRARAEGNASDFLRRGRSALVHVPESKRVRLDFTGRGFEDQDAARRRPAEAAADNPARWRALCDRVSAAHQGSLSSEIVMPWG